MKHAYDDFYINQYNTLEKIKNINSNINTAQCIASPFGDKNNNNNYFNTSYIFTGGNDSTIRYWDLTKEGINYINGNNLNDRGSYIINAPNNLSYANYSKSSFSDFVILQSNESYDDLGKKSNLSGFSEYQNYNGIHYYSSEKNIKSGYSTRNLDVSHKSIITDLLTL